MRLGERRGDRTEELEREVQKLCEDSGGVILAGRVGELSLRNEELERVLCGYADRFCEGWCKDSDGAWGDCDGCEARVVLEKKG